MHTSLPRLCLLLAVVSASPACLYRAGSNLTAGILDEAHGDGRSEGVDGVVRRLVERDLAKQLGNQLGDGLLTRVGDIQPEERDALAQTVDAIVLAATTRAGSGVRDDISPEVRRMLREDVIAVLSDGLSGPVGDSLEQTGARMTEAILSKVREHIEDPSLRESLGELFRDAIYIAMREGGRAPAVGDTLQTTLSENMLTPFEQSISGIADVVAERVDEGNQRLEQMMQGIISALILVVGVFVLLYGLTRRQLTRVREDQASDIERYRAMANALSLLDEDTRAQILSQVDAATTHARLPTKPLPSSASSSTDGYARRPHDSEPPK